MKKPALIVLLLWLAVMLVVGLTDAKAVVDTVWLVSVASLGTDSSQTKPDSVNFFWIDGTGALDSNLAIFQRADSMEARYGLSPSAEGWTSEYAPAAWAIWYWPDGARDRDGSVGPIPWATRYVDSLGQATRIIDSLQAVLDSIQNFDAAGHFMADIQAALDSLNSQDGWVAQQAELDSALHAARVAALRWGALPLGYDSTKTVYRPPTGAANKDSVYVVAFRGGAPDTVLRLKYHHTNVVTVADTTSTKR